MFNSVPLPKFMFFLDSQNVTLFRNRDIADIIRRVKTRSFPRKVTSESSMTGVLLRRREKTQTQTQTQRDDEGSRGRGDASATQGGPVIEGNPLSPLRNQPTDTLIWDL